MVFEISFHNINLQFLESVKDVQKLGLEPGAAWLLSKVLKDSEGQSQPLGPHSQGEEGTIGFRVSLHSLFLPSHSFHVCQAWCPPH